jgi:hypothetical protein
MLGATSTREEPWYVVPADRKWFLRTAVATIIVEHLNQMAPQYPSPSKAQLAEIRTAMTQLASAGAGSNASPETAPALPSAFAPGTRAPPKENPAISGASSSG